MGICKCKKRTDLFCFIHKKAVCENCICTEHQICYVKTYVDWLTDSEYDTPTCGICKGDLKEDNFIRLTCFDLFHPHCLNNYASSLPAHTAKAGYVCPTCSKTIFPNEHHTLLAKKLEEYLLNAPWTKNLRDVSSPSHSSSEVKTNSSQLNNNNNSIQSDSFRNNSNVDSLSNSDPQRIASRKTPIKDHTTIYITDEEDEDKYQRRNITQLFYALGLIQPSKQKMGKQTRLRLNTKRMLVILILILTLTGVFVLGMSLSTSELEEVDEPK